MPDRNHRLYLQVLVAILIGILLGHFEPSFAIKLKPLGDGFIKLIKMLIAPIIFCTVVLGITGVGDKSKLGRIGIKSLVYFEVMTTLALILGLIVVNVLKPGAGMNVDPKTLDPQAIATFSEQARTSSVTQFLLNLIPLHVIDAFAKGDVLQVLVFSVLFGLAAMMLGERVSRVVLAIGEISKILFKIVGWIMLLAPIGALGAMSFTIGKFGIASLTPLAKLMMSFYLTCILFVLLGLGSVLKLTGINIFHFLRWISDEILIVLGTSSSESVLPKIMQKLEDGGCERSVVGLVIPAGYSFNLDGTSIYLTMAALFVAQATNTHLDLGQQFLILGILLISSKGAAGVTGSGFITLAATLSAVPTIPVAGLTLILGVDRFMSEARAITNLIGNSVATVFIAKWENALDLKKINDTIRS